MAHIIHCRICKREIDTDLETNWVMPSTNYYYHSKCYTDWIQRKVARAVTAERCEEDWYDLLKEYVWRDIKLPNINWTKVASQWKNFLKTNKYTPKGIYFAIIYFYEVLHGDAEQAKGGIGIVPSIYYESAQYWANLEAKRQGTLDNVVKQITARQLRPIMNISDLNRRNFKRQKYNLDDYVNEPNGDDGVK